MGAGASASLKGSSIYESGSVVKELELAVADGVAAEADHGGPAVPSHAHGECLNCRTSLKGRYCHSCGQSADDHHRSIGHLLWEALEGFTHLDGRLANTLPALLFHPGRLARDYIEGRRMRHVPPFRLFLISLLIFMLAAEWAVERGHQGAFQIQSTASAPGAHSLHAGNTKIAVATPSDINHALDQDEDAQTPLHKWLRAHIGRAAQNREFYIMLVFEWAHRLAVLMLPILAGLLTLAYIGKRQFFVFDHLVVSMQYFSFCFLVWSVACVMPNVNSSIWTFAAPRLDPLEPLPHPARCLWFQPAWSSLQGHSRLAHNRRSLCLPSHGPAGLHSQRDVRIGSRQRKQQGSRRFLADHPCMFPDRTTRRCHLLTWCCAC